MTTTNFRPDTNATHVHCMGSGHRDSAKLGTCTSCGVVVVKTDKGRILDLNARYNAADRHVEDYACWQPSHECNEELVALHARVTARALEAGDLIIGQHVTVTKGRKVAKGTEGIIRWIGESSFGLRFALEVEGVADRVFIAATNVTATNQLERVEAAVAEAMTAPTIDVHDAEPVDFSNIATMSAARSTGSHAACSHPATKAARAACRKARQSK